MKFASKALLIPGLLISLAVHAVPDDLYLSPDPQAALATARSIVTQDPFANLVTVDASGQPRVRTMEHSPPDENMIVFLATIPGTRKLDQIKQHNQVTLLFDNPGESAFVSIMGTASIHTDPATIKKHAWQSEGSLRNFWPDFPNNYVLIKVVPQWLEVVHPDIQSRDSDWRPQGVVFDHKQ